MLGRLLMTLGICFAVSKDISWADEAPRQPWWGKEISAALEGSSANRSEIEKALLDVPSSQRSGMAFLITNMPVRDLTTLKADFLLKNTELAYSARETMPWGKQIPEEIFFNDVLAYVSATETREPWRQEMMEICLPLVKNKKTITEAAQAINAELFTKVKVKYSTLRNRPDQSPSESRKTGLASCTGLSILLIDGCRSVGIPARLVGIPQWVHKPGNHTWVEIWDGDWHFTGACEHDAGGLNRAWFVGDAALAKKDSVRNAIYASSFKKTGTRFPLVWAPENQDVFAENVTDRYAKPVLKEKESTSKLPNEISGKIYDAAKAFFDAPPRDQKNLKWNNELDSFLRAHPDAARSTVWRAYVASASHKELRDDFEKKIVRHEKHLSPYTVKHVGKKPKDGWPIFIAMHGGGGVPKPVNDSQWDHMKIYYRDQPEAGGYIYVALRAPNDIWNGFYDDYMCPLAINLIRQFTLFGDVDANKVFLMGYSHGGYGAFFIGPKIPDRFAAVHASAAAPTDGTISAKVLRNTRFTFMIGEHDKAYGRRDRCEKFAAEIDNLRKENAGEYPVEMEYKKGFGHGGLPDRDKIKDMIGYTRNPFPKHLTWEPTDSHLKDFYWLSVNQPTRGQFADAIATKDGITLRTEKISQATLYVDERLISLESELPLTVNGRKLHVKAERTLRNLCESLQRRGDIHLAASCRVDIDIEKAAEK